MVACTCKQNFDQGDFQLTKLSLVNFFPLIVTGKIGKNLSLYGIYQQHIVHMCCNVSYTGPPGPKGEKEVGAKGSKGDSGPPGQCCMYHIILITIAVGL